MPETNESSSKIVTFSCDNREFVYKFSPNESWKTIERIIRTKFRLSSGTAFSLFDIRDNTVISEEYLSCLINNARVRIDIEEDDQLAKAVSAIET
jgi:hypothetical protein